MGSYLTYSIPGKTAALVPEFAVEDLPSAKLEPGFLRLQRRTCPWAKHTDGDDDPTSFHENLTSNKSVIPINCEEIFNYALQKFVNYSISIGEELQ